MNIIGSNIKGQSQSIKCLRTAIETMAQYSAPVLITGETGTGKELVARGLHYGGKFANKPFIAINCSTFTDELFASELFGYRKGAFTDAKSDKEGLLVSAAGGTIFLDEVDSLSPKSQAALLRVIQESEFRPIGSTTVLKTNVRFIAAANCNLEKSIIAGEFRQDLYFRLYILSVSVPALRERKEDIPLLAEHFIQKLNTNYGLNKQGITSRLLAKFQTHHWPGNVRELENTIHRYYLLAKSEYLDEAVMVDAMSQATQATQAASNAELNTPRCVGFSENQPMEFVESGIDNQESSAVLSSDDNTLSNELESGCLNFSDAKRQAIENFEARFVSRLLKFTEGNITKAATLCGKERRAFGKLVKKYNIKNQEINLY
ncbi:hypothetical protein tinsulaeT_37230 [Thalassotalea insulae]|uniref:Sigma-54 factor interaction domain-containing protein n=1 Tax=Thalassotalea insulae TaxID=2056778 RepID=A0ABQ6GWT8_9GAMM|nr:sigma-54 dependent transcriptional regulator [Thalassotalea insulae]GLX80383.1 hypothetical protein tinsulaeT_37230 [Thalassotalea insulae]